jgi:uncharacterized protein YjaZ
MNINLHLLNASGSLDDFAEHIKNTFDQTIKTISEKVKISDIDIVIYDHPYGAIPEIGIGGYAPSANLIFISLNPKFPDLSKSLNQELKSTLAHEIHHCLRWQKPGYGNTLLEALISEGLADHFDLEINGSNPRLWMTALDQNQISVLLEKAKTEFSNDVYDHNAWFFGSEEKDIPRWTGYSLGFKIVSDYLEKNKDKKPSSLYNTTSEEIISNPTPLPYHF